MTSTQIVAKAEILSKIEKDSQIIQGLKAKYNVSGYLDLEKKIKQGKIPGHPAWEDVILWEQLFTHSTKLSQQLKSR